MNTTQQAYINGFVKRASEYGLEAASAEVLLKEATTFGATRNLLRLLKSQGVTVSRSAKDMGNILNSSDGGFFGKRFYSDLVRSQGPAFTPIAEKGTIYLPRRSTAYAKGSRKPPAAPWEKIEVPVNSPSNVHGANALKVSNFPPLPPPVAKLNASPRELLFHEGGHAMHYMEDPVGLTAARFGGEPTLATERIANNNAINFMRQNKVPESNISNYKRNVDHAYSSYAQPSSGQYFPGYSVE